MKIILAQGNPGAEYEKTRHNVGFLAIDFFAHQNSSSFQAKSKFHAEIAEIKSSDEKILLIKPTTYYNETGIVARTLADFYKVKSADILVIHDDLALPLGTIRMREKGRDAGNNGIKSINAHLGENYARIRIGIRNDLTDQIDATDFVLSRFTSIEQEKLTADILPAVSSLINDFIAGNHTHTSYKV